MNDAMVAAINELDEARQHLTRALDHIKLVCDHCHPDGKLAREPMNYDSEDDDCLFEDADYYICEYCTLELAKEPK